MGQLRILLVEGHADTARLMARLMTGLGHRVAVACGVEAALEAASAAEFDLLVSESDLPDGTGVELMRRLRPMQAVAVTAYLSPEDERQAKDAGFAAVLDKPVDMGQLEATLDRVAGVNA